MLKAPPPLATLLLTLSPITALGQGMTRLANICTIKGQEEDVLRGIGLVVGLNGTGESNDPATMRALSRAMELMGNPVSTTGRFDESAERSLRNIKNAALVMVTATVPRTGAVSGARLDCNVSALNGKSIEGGRLAFASLQGPNTQDPTIYALCEGAIHVADPAMPTVGTIHNGCGMVRSVTRPFVSDDGWVTIVLDPSHASFSVIEQVAIQISYSYVEDFLSGELALTDSQLRTEYVQALDATRIRVRVPARYENDHVGFIHELLEKSIYGAEPEARVVCNTMTGSVVISGDVTIGDVVFTHRNLVVDTGQANGFEKITQTESVRPRLQRLLTALNSLNVPATDVIEIIRGIDRLGKLHAKLIVL